MATKRLYNGADAHIIERIDAMVGSFELYQSEFTAFDNNLDATFLTNWKNAEPRLSAPSADYIEVSEAVALRGEALTALGKCQVKYMDVKYFVRKAFPKNKEILKEFGEGQYTKVRASPLAMVQFMETLSGVANKYKTQLNAAGFSQTKIDEIATLATALRDDNKAQQLKKKERPSATRQRIEVQNSYYGYAQRVAAAANIIYRNSPARRGAFRLSVFHSHRPAKLTVKINGNKVRKIKLPDNAAGLKLTLTNPGNSPVEYWQGDKLRETPAAKNILNPTQSAEIIATGKKFLLIRNLHSAQLKVLWMKEKKE